MEGLKLAILYGFYPHRLGFCGPREKTAAQDLLNFISGRRVSEKKIRKTMKEFKGAYPYYKLIAKCNKISDPFDERVVRAYWVGSGLLERVSVASLRKMIIKDFSKPELLPKKIAEKKAKEIPDNSKPHHSFHVLVLGSVSGKIVLQGKLLDFCRVGWGRVEKLEKKDKISVKYQPLTGKKNLILGKAVRKNVVWNKALIPEIKIGNWVSLHWGQPIQVLSKKDLSSLKKYTKITLASIDGK